MNIPRNEECKLNAYDRNPNLLRSLIKEVSADPEFQSLDKEATLKIPSLLTNFKCKNDKGRIDWIHLLDHFQCRYSHSRSYTDIEEKWEKEFEKEVEIARGHLEERFEFYYKDDEVLHEVRMNLKIISSIFKIINTPFLRLRHQCSKSSSILMPTTL